MKELNYALAAGLAIASTIIIATSGESILIRYISAVVTVALIVKLVTAAPKK